MPLLPLPAGGSTLAGGDLPVSDAGDVLAVFPEEYRQSDTAPVRDALCEAFADSWVEYQIISELAAAQCDPLRATGDYLSQSGSERGIRRAKDEDEEDYRARIFTTPDLVSPQAVIDAVNKLLAPYTTKRCSAYEPEVDGMFAHDGTAVWDCFVGADPHYQDRLYPDDADENGGDFFECSTPGGAVPSNGVPRSFVIRIPVLTATDQSFAFVVDDSELGIFIGNGSDTGGSESDGSVATSVYAETVTVEELCASIIGEIEAIKGQGMVWTCLEDASL